MTNAINRGEPPYLQIARHYREQIERRELQPGQLLPSVREMAERWGVAHTTAARALKALQAEGLVTSTSGAGTFVTVPSGPRTAEQLATHLRDTGQFYPPGYHSVILGAELHPAPQRIADALGLNEGEPVIRRWRVTYDDTDSPIEASTCYLPGDFAEAAPALLSTEPLSNGILGYIEQQTGHRAEIGCDQYAAFPASEENAAALSIAPGSPVLIERHWWSTKDGTVMQYSESVEPGDKWRTHRYAIPSHAD
jgi:DNA-binding GntR family transcriptional regulator